MAGLEVPELLTARFRCRSLREGDEEAMWEAFSDPETMRYWGRGAFTDKLEFRDYLFGTSWGGRTWIAEPLAGGAPVFRMYASQEGKEVSEIGYILPPRQQGQGIARECLTALITHLFRRENVHRIFADVDPRNRASNALLVRLGFTREAHLREAIRTHLGWCDTWLWGLLAEEWPH